MKNTICIIGATSDVGRELARIYSQHNWHIILVARQSDRLIPLKQDLAVRYGEEAELIEFDLMNLEDISVFEKIAFISSTVICVAGLLGDQNAAEEDQTRADEILKVNYLSPALILNRIGHVFEQKGKGTIIGISSVAGERGRKKNYLYGSAKAGFTAYLSGMRNRLFAKGIHVMTVIPGFIDTKMTANLDLPQPITASAAEVAKAIFQGHQKQKNIIYTLPIWRFIMLIIRNIPETIFKKLDL